MQSSVTRSKTSITKSLPASFKLSIFTLFSESYNKIHCFIKGNTLFAIGKRSFISRAYKEKALQINDSQSLIEYSKRDLNPHSRNGQRILSPSCLPFHHSSILKREKRAENETRTRDPNLGKVMLYQLSYFRIFSTGAKIMSFLVSAKLSIKKVWQKIFIALIMLSQPAPFHRN